MRGLLFGFLVALASVACADAPADDAAGDDDSLISKDAQIVDDVFRGELIAAATDDAKKAIVKQLFYVVGPLTTKLQANAQVGRVVLSDVTERIVNAGWLDLGTDGDVPLRVLATTDPIPCDAIAHRPGMASGLVERLAKTLVEVEDDAEGRGVLRDVFHTTGMMRADLRIYESVREAMQRVAKLRQS